MWPHPPSHLLLDHADSLRSMARALLRDEHAADDVVQDTWVRALVAAPSTDRGLGGWLQRVAEGFARRHRRAEARQVERQQRYAADRPEAFDTEQRSVVLRAVFEAVLALDEPYRETVLLRWFEGLPPRAIAERLGVRVATVDSRLQRAHARLRATLERDLRDERGGWRACIAVCLGAPRAEASALTFALPLIGVVVGLKTFAGAAAAVIALCLWFGWDRSTPEYATPPELAAAAPVERDADPLATASSTHARAPASDPEADAAKAARAAAIPHVLERGPHRFDLRVEVVDANERPVQDAQVDLGPLSGSLARFGETSWEGLLTRGWFGFEPRMECVIAVRQRGGESASRRIVLESDARNEFRFQLDPTGRVREIRLSLAASSETVTVGGRLVVSEPDDAFVVDAAGNGMFVDRDLARVIEAHTVEARAAAEAIELSLDVVRADTIVENVRFSEARRAKAEVELLHSSGKTVKSHAPATVRGIVTDENGRPLAECVVSARTPSRWNTGVVTNAAGEFVFENVPPGTFDVDVGGGLRHVVRERLELAGGETRFVDLRPMPRAVTRLTLSDAGAQPLSSWRVEARSASVAGLVLGAATTDEAGAAEIGLSSDEPFLIYARPASRADSPAAFVGRQPSAPRDVLNLRLLDEARPGSILVTVDAPKNLEVEARAWRVDGDEGLTLHESAVRRVGVEDDRKPNPRLLPGRWRVEMRATGRPWTSIGEYALAPGEELDLGLTALPPCATLRMELDGADEARRVVSLRAVVDGALVQWPERALNLPVEIETFGETETDVLTRHDRDGAPTTRTHATPRRFPIGTPHAIGVR